MYYHNNDYLIPVLALWKRDTAVAARQINLSKGIIPHVFAVRIGLGGRIFCRYHKIHTDKDMWLLQNLCDFAYNLDEPYCPAFIVYNEDSRRFAKENSEALESSYLIIELEDFLDKNRKEKET